MPFRLDAVASSTLTFFKELVVRLALVSVVACIGLAMIFLAEKAGTAEAAAHQPAGVAAGPHEKTATVFAPAAPEHSLGVKVLDELGFALLVSSGVWLVFELQLHLRTEREFSHRLSQIAKSVFEGVLGSNLPPRFIDEVKRVALEVKLVREDFNAHYTLRDASFTSTSGVPTPYVELVNEVSFKIRNVSPHDMVYEIATAIPNPVHPELRSLVSVKVVDAILNGAQLKLDLGKAEKAFRKNLTTEKGPNVGFSAGQVTLRNTDLLTVKIEVVMAKEEEDSELLELVIPSNRMTVSVTEANITAPRRIFVRSVHRVPVDGKPTPANPLRQTLSIDDYILPHQGVLLGWKRAGGAAPAAGSSPAHDAAPKAAPTNDAASHEPIMNTTA